MREAAEESDGGDLRRWVDLFDDYSPAELKTLLTSLPQNEDDADVILTTGHKAKGLEWDRVRLCDDFLKGIGETNKDGTPKTVDPAQIAAELRLFYVAATRGRVQLEVPPTLSAKLAAVPCPPAKAVSAPAPEQVQLASVVETPVPARSTADDEFEPIAPEALSAPVLARSTADDEFEPISAPAAETPAGGPAKARRKRFSDAEWVLIAEALQSMRPGRADAGDVKSVALIDKALAKIGGVRAAA